MARSSTRASGATSKATKKSAGKKSAGKNTAGKKTASKKTAARKSTDKDTERPSQKTSQKQATPKKTVPRKTTRKEPARDSGSRASADAPRAEAARRPRAGQVAAQAAAELLELTGKSAEGVTGLERTDEGWTVQVEVVEVHRIPNTTDVLALYEVQTDERGSLMGYRRLKRYTRGAPGED